MQWNDNEKEGNKLKWFIYCLFLCISSNAEIVSIIIQNWFEPTES